MKTAREIAHEFAGVSCFTTGRGVHSTDCNRATTAIEVRDAEVTEPMREVLRDLVKGVAAHDDCACILCRAIRSLAPPPGGTK
jgi:hypothetical protein